VTGHAPEAALQFSAGLLGYASRDYDTARVAEAAALAERLGYDAWWVADQRWSRDVWVTLAACAGRTERIGLGTRLVDPYSKHPALTAAAIATLDEMSGGRAILGIGAGGSGFREMGIERHKPVTAIREAIELIRRLLDGEQVDYDGEIVRFAGAKLGYAVPRRVPIFVVGRGPKVLQLAGRVADGAMIASLSSPRSFQWAIEHIRAGSERAGRELGEIDLALMAYVSISDDLERARWAVRRGIMATLMGSYPTLDFLEVEGLELTPELRALLESGERDPARFMPHVPEEYVDRLAIAGTASEVSYRIRALADLGMSHLVLAPLPVEGQSAEDLLTAFASDVIPRFTPAHIARDAR
jgi:5,10-methylenetetrahydromethanopterin reductase